LKPTDSSNVDPQAVSTLGIALVSGFGGLLTFYIPEYTAAGKGYADITQLMTYPTLFMLDSPPLPQKNSNHYAKC